MIFPNDFVRICLLHTFFTVRVTYGRFYYNSTDKKMNFENPSNQSNTPSPEKNFSPSERLPSVEETKTAEVAKHSIALLLKNYELNPDWQKEDIDRLRNSYENENGELLFGQILLEQSVLEEAHNNKEVSDDVYRLKKNSFDTVTDFLGRKIVPELKTISLNEYLVSRVSEMKVAMRDSSILVKDRNWMAKKADFYDRLSVISNLEDIAHDDYKELLEDLNNRASAGRVTIESLYTGAASGESVISKNIKELLRFEEKAYLEAKHYVGILKQERAGGEKVEFDEVEQQKKESPSARSAQEKFAERRRLSPTEFRKHIGDFVDKGKNIEITEDIKARFLTHILGTLDLLKEDLILARKKLGNNLVKFPGTVAGVLGNGGNEVALLQIIEAQRGHAASVRDLLPTNFRETLKNALGYEIPQDEWENYFSS